MAVESKTGVKVNTQAIADKVPDALPQKYLILENLSGDGGQDLLDKIENKKFEHEKAIKASSLQEAFDHFAPQLEIEVPKSSDPNDTQKTKVEFRDLQDFNADELIKRIPDLFDLDTLENGYLSLLKFLETKDGQKWLESCVKDKNFLTSQIKLSKLYSEYYLSLEKVINERRDRD